jgi:hypothetical protein
VLDPVTLHVTCTTNLQRHDVAWDGQAFLVSWNTQSLTQVAGTATLGRRIASDGTFVGTLPFTIRELGDSGRLACDGASTCLWVDESASEGVRIAKGGGALPGTITLPSGAGGSRASVSFNGTDFVVGWRTSTGATSAARVAPSTGAIVDGTPIAITSSAYEALAAAPTGQTLFVWADAGSAQLRGVRLTNAGQVLDATPLTLTSGASVAAASGQPVPTVVAAGSDRYLVAWGDMRGGPDGATLYAARIGLDGLAMDGAVSPACSPC